MEMAKTGAMVTGASTVVAVYKTTVEMWFCHPSAHYRCLICKLSMQHKLGKGSTYHCETMWMWGVASIKNCFYIDIIVILNEY